MYSCGNEYLYGIISSGYSSFSHPSNLIISGEVHSCLSISFRYSMISLLLDFPINIHLHHSTIFIFISDKTVPSIEMLTKKEPPIRFSSLTETVILLSTIVCLTSKSDLTFH